MAGTTKRVMTSLGEVEIYEGTGNVFEDLGFPDADEHVAKAELFIQIKHIIKTRKLTQAAAAKLCGLDQPKMSKLLNAKLYGFSTEQLMHILTALGRDIEIVVTKPPRGRKGKITVRAA